MSSWTPEPWGFRSGGGTVAHIIKFERGEFDVEIARSMRLANAKRTVACVNALKGIEDPEAWRREVEAALLECRKLIEKDSRYSAVHNALFDRLLGLTIPNEPPHEA